RSRAERARGPPGWAVAARGAHRRSGCEQSLPPTGSVAGRDEGSGDRGRERASDASGQALAV
ncbi:dipeptide ABC transporter ATP-binding protein DppD, partial [Klebsiella pneumoniae]